MTTPTPTRRPRRTARQNDKLPKGWRWVQPGERTRLGDKWAPRLFYAGQNFSVWAGFICATSKTYIRRIQPTRTARKK